MVNNHTMIIISVVAAVSPPSTTYLEDKCSSQGCFKGLLADIFHTLQESLNFTYTIELVKSFGGYKNGSWTGMIGTYSLQSDLLSILISTETQTLYLASTDRHFRVIFANTI